MEIILSDKAQKELDELRESICGECPFDNECDRINCKIKLK